MAFVVVNIDTEKQTLSVSIDDKKISDVKSVSCYYYNSYDDKEDEQHLDTQITTLMKGDNGINKQVRYYSSSSKDFNSVEVSGNTIFNKDLPTFIGKEVGSNLVNDVYKYFLGKDKEK